MNCTGKSSHFIVRAIGKLDKVFTERLSTSDVE